MKGAACSAVRHSLVSGQFVALGAICLTIEAASSWAAAVAARARRVVERSIFEG